MSVLCLIGSGILTTTPLLRVPLMWLQVNLEDVDTVFVTPCTVLEFLIRSCVEDWLYATVVLTVKLTDSRSV